jgi:hypothetical protein
MYTEPIEIKSVGTTPDGAGGFIFSKEVVLRCVNANVVERTLQRTDQNGRLIFQKIYNVEFYHDEFKALNTKHFIKYRDLKLIVQNIESDQRRRKVKMVCIADL